MTAVADIVAALHGKRAGSQWMARCPAHLEKTASLAIAEGDDGRVLLRCHAGCPQARVIDALRRLGLWSGEARELTEAELAAMRQAAAERERETARKQARAIDIWCSTLPIIARDRSAGRDCTSWQGNIAMTDARIWRGTPASDAMRPKVEWRQRTTPAEIYLRSRQITPDVCLYEHGYPDTIGWCDDAGLDPSPSEAKPALVAAVRDNAGKVQAIQRTFLDLKGRPVRDKSGKKVKYSLGPIAGHAWQTDMLGEHLRWGLAEGVESALAAAQLFRFPVWAAISAGNLEQVTPPPWAREAIVFADNDHSGTGHKAAVAALMRLRQMPQIGSAKIWMPPTIGHDVADHLCDVVPYA